MRRIEKINERQPRQRVGQISAGVYSHDRRFKGFWGSLKEFEVYE